MASINGISKAVNQRKQKANLAKKLDRSDSNKWNPQIYSIREKLIVDTLLHDIKKKCIIYALSQISNVLFTEMKTWFESNEDAATLDKFLKEAKHFTKIHYLKTNAKQKLLTITMQHSETVSKHY